MNLIKHRAFVEAARTGSLTAAALSLNYTQPGISHMISSLEKDFGFALLHRSKHGVTLTEEGQRIFRLCQELLDRQDALENAVKQINGAITGTLRIGGYLSVLTNWFPDVVKIISAQYPQLELHLFEGNKDEQIQLLKNNAIDVGILSSSAPDGCDFIPIHKDPAVAILPADHELCKKEVLTTADLLYYPMLIQPENASEMLKSILGEQYLVAKGNLITKSDQALLRLVESGIGIGVVGRMVVQSTDKVEVRRLDKTYERTIGFAVPKWRPITPSLQEFINIVCDLYQDKHFAAASKGAGRYGSFQP